MTRIGQLDHHTTATHSLNSTTQAVPVVLSNKYATPSEEARALLSALGFSDEDIKAYNQEHSLDPKNPFDLKQFITDEFTKRAKDGHVNYNAGTYFGPTAEYPMGGYKTSINVSEHNYKVLTDFIKERRSPKQEAVPDDAELTKQYKMQEIRNQGAMMRAKAEKNLPVAGSMTAALPNTLPLAPELPKLPLPTAASVASLIEAAPPVAVAAIELAPIAYLAWEVGNNIAQEERQAQLNAHRASLEAASLAQLLKMAPTPPIYTSDGSETKTKEKSSTAEPLDDVFKPAPGGTLVPTAKGQPAAPGSGSTAKPENVSPATPGGSATSPNRPQKPSLPDLTGPAIGLTTAAAGKKLVDLVTDNRTSLVQIELKAKQEALRLERLDGGHSVDRHGPEVSDIDLQRRLTTGIAPDGKFSPTPASTRFNTYQDWLQTRQAAWDGIEAKFNVDFSKAPGATDPRTYEIIIEYNRAIDDGYVADLPSGARVSDIATHKTGKVYSSYQPVDGITRTKTRVSWNDASKKWEVVQHYPDAKGWNNSTKTYSASTPAQLRVSLK
jgi:hypothetical protein